MKTLERRTQRVQQQVGEMAWAVPQVVSRRVTQMMFAGALPSAADRREFETMGAEKLYAFSESWLAMGVKMVQVQQEMGAAWLKACTQVPSTQWLPQQMTEAMQAAGLGVLGAGLAPVHQRAVSNAKRLRRR